MVCRGLMKEYHVKEEENEVSKDPVCPLIELMQRLATCSTLPGALPFRPWLDALYLMLLAHSIIQESTPTTTTDANVAEGDIPQEILDLTSKIDISEAQVAEWSYSGEDSSSDNQLVTPATTQEYQDVSILCTEFGGFLHSLFPTVGIGYHAYRVSPEVPVPPCHELFFDHCYFHEVKEISEKTVGILELIGGLSQAHSASGCGAVALDRWYLTTLISIVKEVNSEDSSTVIKLSNELLFKLNQLRLIGIPSEYPYLGYSLWLKAFARVDRKSN